MALAPRLDLRQSQQLVMTPQLQQAIKLLQLSNMELSEFVWDEVEKNPLLEVAEGEAGDSRDADGSGDSGGDARGTDGQAADGGAEDFSGNDDARSEAGADTALGDDGDRTAGADAPLDTDYSENVFNNDSGSDTEGVDMSGEQLGYNGLGAVQSGGSGGGGLDDRTLEERLGDQLTLRDHIEEQLHLLPLAMQERMIASYLTDLLDDAGYIGETMEEVACQLGCPAEDVERVLGILQGLEPAGIFARDLAECLALQLKEQNRYDPYMEKLLAHLDLLAKRDFGALKRVCGIDKEDLADMIMELQALNPKPGLALAGGEPVQPVVPDVFVKKLPSGSWTVELNSETLPRVLVNSRYYAELNSLAGSKADKAFVSDCYANANWLVKALDQRARTILKVSTEIVRQQEGFFEQGVRALKPLNLRAIAEAIGMHESTVSRVTSNKYMATSRGILEFKYFFTSAISGGAGGEMHSAEAVRDRIRELIDNEKPDAILSDDKIVEILAGEDVEIARRTVAKYRESMNIPSSVRRRREKNLLG